LSDKTTTEKKGQSGRKSLVRRISAQQIADQMALLFFFDFAILIALALFFMVSLSAASVSIVKMDIEKPLHMIGLPFDSYTVDRNVQELYGRRLFKPELALLDMPEGSYIGFSFRKISEISFMGQWADTRSFFSLPSSDGGYDRVVFTHDSMFSVFFRFGAAILFFQAIYMLRAAIRIRRRARHTLRPITELTLAAQSINTTQATQAEPALKLSGAIDTLNTITERHLDRRISIDDERVELKGLASAINGMLDRLDAAYNAQLRFVSDASHELRTPISVIQGYANLLDRWGKNDEKALQESIDAIKNESDNMKILVEQLLFLARGENRSISISVDDVDISALVEEVVREAKMIDEKHEYNVKTDESLNISGDYQLLKQALRILVDNSVKFTAVGGKISLSTARSASIKGYIDIVVKDNGIGIAAEAIPYIFDRFYKADESRARSAGGTGLGLSIAKWIVENHQGAIDVVSSEDAGTRITLSFKEKPLSFDV
jgi:signal transduction histidine kinase